MMYNAVNNQTPNYLSSRFFPRNEALKGSYPYHSRALVIENEVLATAGCVVE